MKYNCITAQKKKIAGLPQQNDWSSLLIVANQNKPVVVALKANLRISVVTEVRVRARGLWNSHQVFECYL